MPHCTGVQTPRTLAITGKHLARQRQQVTGVANSMHETCLKHSPPIPTMSCIQAIEDALVQDQKDQLKKYRGREPSGAAARFRIELPQSPQSTKFCYRPVRGPDSTCGLPTVGEDHPADRNEDDLDSASHRGDDGDVNNWFVEDDQPTGEDMNMTSTYKSFRFNMQTLRRWFKDIDVKKSGSIKQRELIVALRQHKVLQALFCSVQGLDFTDGKKILGVESQVQARRDEITRIKRILDEIDSDGSGSMEWEEFVEFFRRTGLLLEYQTRSSLNRPNDVESNDVEDLESHPPEPLVRRNTVSHMHRDLSKKITLGKMQEFSDEDDK